MSLLIKSGGQYFEVSETDLAACEIAPQDFEAACGVADRSLVSESSVPAFNPLDPAWNALNCAQVCDTYSGYGASCSKAPNCP